MWNAAHRRRRAAGLGAIPGNLSSHELGPGGDRETQGECHVLSYNLISNLSNRSPVKRRALACWVRRPSITLERHCGHRHAPHSSFVLPAAYTDRAAVLTNYLLADPQAEPGPHCLFGREERLEDALKVLSSNTTAGVRDGQSHDVALIADVRQT